MPSSLGTLFMLGRSALSFDVTIPVQSEYVLTLMIHVITWLFLVYWQWRHAPISIAGGSDTWDVDDISSKR
jgi:hypothetical protein